MSTPSQPSEVVRPFKYRIHRRGPAFGDLLLAAHATCIINDNGFDAVLDDARTETLKSIVTPIWDGKDERLEWRFSYNPGSSWDGRSIMRKALDNFAQTFSIANPLVITRGNIAVKVAEDPATKPVDVVICSQSGYWSPYRNWPHFKKLKELIARAGLTLHDLSQSNELGSRCLDRVLKARIYVGLETGTSHFVSGVARRALILQSGYSDIDYWSTYGYSYIVNDVECRRCFLNYSQKCPFDHKCMESISAQFVCHVLQHELLKGERLLGGAPRPNQRVG